MFSTEWSLYYTDISNVTKNRAIIKTTPITLGPCFENFSRVKIVQRRYNNVSEMLRAALYPLEENEGRLVERAFAFDQSNASSRVGGDTERHLHIFI